MVKISVDKEDIQNIVNIVLKYSDMSIKKRSVVSVNFEDCSFSLQNEIVQLKFKNMFTILDNTSNIEGFSFDVRSISKLKYPNDIVELEYLNKVVYVKSGKLKSNIKSEFKYQKMIERKVDVIDTMTISNKNLQKAILKVKLPYSFYRGDANKSPIGISGSGSKVEVFASDGYSLCRFTSKGSSTENFNVVVPRIILSSFLNKNLEAEGDTKIEIQEMSVRITCGDMLLISSQLSDKVDSFQSVLDRLSPNWSFISELPKKELSMALKSISGSMSDKKSVNYIQCKIKPNDNCFDLSYNNSKTGGITYSDIVFNKLEYKDEGQMFSVKLHAKSFEEFTVLMESDFEWCGSSEAVYYKESSELGFVEYLYPTINI